MRFGYLLWIRHLEHGTIPGFAELGREIGDAAGGAALSGQAISGWSKRDEAPDSYRNNNALAAVLGVSPSWLIDNEGEAPRPELWKAWTAAREREAKAPLGKMKKALLAAPRSTTEKTKRRGRA